MTTDVLGTLVLDAASCAHSDSYEDIARALRLGAKLAVADIVFDRELRARGGERLMRRGLRVECLEDVRPAIAVRRDHPHLSLGDAFSVALVAANRWTLLTCSPPLARLAAERGIAVSNLRGLVEHLTLAHTLTRVSYPRSEYGLVA